MRIEADQRVARIGDRIQFVATLQNGGGMDVRVPVRPVLLYVWVYSNGRKDQVLVTLSEKTYYSPDQTIIVKPGQQVKWVEEIDTRWFPFAGITEFQALWIPPENTNSDLEGFVTGQISSNRFGVQMKSR